MIIWGKLQPYIRPGCKCLHGMNNLDSGVNVLNFFVRNLRIFIIRPELTIKRDCKYWTRTSPLFHYKQLKITTVRVFLRCLQVVVRSGTAEIGPELHPEREVQKFRRLASKLGERQKGQKHFPPRSRSGQHLRRPGLKKAWSF